MIYFLEIKFNYQWSILSRPRIRRRRGRFVLNIHHTKDFKIEDTAALCINSQIEWDKS